MGQISRSGPRDWLTTSQGRATNGISFLWAHVINSLVPLVVSLSTGLRRRAVH
jgi:hypothetical protein